MTFAELAEMPGIGRLWNALDERLSGIRVWRVRGFNKHLVFYRPVGDGIEVLHVLHGSRDVVAILLDDVESKDEDQ